MTQTLPSDTIALIASEPEHCLDCFRLIRPGETYHQGKDNTVLCPMCACNLLIGEDFGTIQATDHVAIDVLHHIFSHPITIGLAHFK